MPYRLCSCNPYGYLVLVTERQARDEGARQTQLIANAMRQSRYARNWSAQQLAEEMTKAGVPWNADIVVNLEHGRRKSLRVHELLALLFVLDVPKPLEVIVPGDESFPVVPGLVAPAEDVRAWLRGEGRPLRQLLGENEQSAVMDSAAQLFEQQGRPDLAAEMRRLAGLLTTPEDGGAESHDDHGTGPERPDAAS
jgi:transcriptional regulator with XRE-family HTH domain